MSDEHGKPVVAVSSRADVRVENLVDELMRTTSTLAISLRTLKRNPVNVVFRASVEQQYHTGKLQLQSLVSLPTVAYGQEAAERAAGAAAPFLELCRQLDWLPHDDEIRDICQVVADAVHAPDRLAAEGAPCPAFLELLAPHARIPERSVQPEQAQGPVVLHESQFRHAAGTVGHEGFVGEMFLAYLQHVRGLSADDARRALTPAGLVGFAQSIEKALAGYEGSVTFRILREDGKARVVLQRTTAAS